MPYVEKNLGQNEQVIYKASVHWFIFTKSIMIFIAACYFSLVPQTQLFGLALFFFFVPLFFDALIKKSKTELAVTNKRVIAKFGWISINTIELNLSKVEGIRIHQNALGRLFNFGNLSIGGTGGQRTPINYVSAPLKFRKTVNDLTEN